MGAGTTSSVKSLGWLEKTLRKVTQRYRRYRDTVPELTRTWRQARKKEKALHEAIESKQARLGRRKDALGTQQARLVAEQAKEKPDHRVLQGVEQNVKNLLKEIEKLRKEIDVCRAQAKEQRQKVLLVRKRVRRAVTRKRYWGKRARFFLVKVKHRKDLIRQRREKKNPTFEPWMANGCDYANCNQATRDATARMVVTYGLTTTSMARTYIPAGGSSTSHHLAASVDGDVARAVDAAGPWDTMVAAQRAEYKRFRNDADKLELFGPDNALNLKYGQPLYLAEGSALENLHDTHVHSAQN